MHLSQNDEHHFPLSRFESMLKTNDVLFFDSNEFELIIYHYLENGKFPLAKKAVKLGLEQHPNSTSLQLFQIEILIFENKLEKAEEMLNSLYDLEPSNEEVYVQKANIFSKRDQHREAIETLELALEVAAEENDIYSLIAMEYMFLEDYENAKINFMRCLEIDEQDYAALYNIIYCFDFLNQTEEAIAFLNDLLERNPYSEIAWHEVGKQYFAKKDYKRAVTALDFAIISDDTFIGAYLEKAKVLEKLKQYEDAITNYQITLQLDDPTAFAYLRIGKCYEKINRADLAIKHYKEAVKEDPLLDKAWVAITDFHFKRSEFEKALHYINKAMDIDSENVLYWKRFAKINHQLSHYKAAQKGFQKSLDLGNFELETWVTLCDVLITLDKIETGISILLQAKEFYPETAEIEYRLAGLYFKNNQGEKAYKHLKNALAIDSEYVIIIEELFPDIFKRKSIQNLIAAYSA